MLVYITLISHDYFLFYLKLYNNNGITEVFIFLMQQRKPQMLLKNVKRPFWLPANDMLSDSLKLFSGTTLGQIIPFLAGPILSRLYSPSDFGLYALLSSTAGILSIISTGAYEYAVLTADNEEESDQLSLLSAFLSAAFSALSGIIIAIMLVFAQPWAENSLGWIWLIIPIFIVFQGLTNVSNYSLNRQQRYGRMSKGKFLKSLFTTLFQVILGVAKIPWGLFPGTVGGTIISSSYQCFGVKDNLIRASKAFSFVNLKKLAKKYYRFPAFTMPSQLLNELSVQVPVYLLKAFFTTAVVGIYALPQKLLNVPVMLIGNSIGQVYFQKAAQQRNDFPALAETTKSLFRFLFRIGVLPFSIILVFGDHLFPWIFGAEWQQSGIFAQMLSPWLLFVLIGSPISKLFTVQNKQKLGLFSNSILISLRVASLLIGGLLFRSEMISILLFGLAGFAYWFCLSFYILRMARVNILPVFAETIFIWSAVLAVLLAFRFLFAF